MLVVQAIDLAEIFLFLNCLLILTGNRGGKHNKYNYFIIIFFLYRNRKDDNNKLKKETEYRKEITQPQQTQQTL